MTGPAVDVLDSVAFARLVGPAAHVYGAAMQRGPELVVQRREIMQSHVHRGDFVAVVVPDPQDPDGLVGFGYGYRGRSGDWWHDTVAAALGKRLAKRWLADAFELAELHVHPHAQGRGLGRLLLQRLLDITDTATVVLSTHDSDSPARRLYRSTGFVDLRCGFVFPGSTEVYALMGLDRTRG